MEHLFGLLEVVQMAEVPSPTCQGEPGMLADPADIRQRRVHPTDSLQNALQREQLILAAFLVI